MKRASFLRLLAVAPFAAATLTPRSLLSEQPPEIERPLESDPGLLDQVEYWSGGLRPDWVWIDQLPQTSEAEKWRVQVHYNGATHTKTVVVSGPDTSMNRASRRSETAYSLIKALRGCTMDMAFRHYGDDYRRHCR